MHNNFFFLSKLANALQQRLVGARLADAFSQNKDELICNFETSAGQDFFIKAALSPSFTCLSFPENFSKTKKNAASIFTDIHQLTVIAVEVIPFDRSFIVHFENNYQLLFKMHGNRSNILLLKENRAQALFKNKLENDWQITPESLAKDFQLTEASFQEKSGNLQAFMPFLGPFLKQLLKEHISDDDDLSIKFKKIATCYHDLTTASSYYIIQHDGNLHLSLLPEGAIQFTETDPLKAITNFFYTYISDFTLDKEKLVLTRILNKRIKQGEQYIAKNHNKLKELDNAVRPEQLADIIMANMHALKTGVREATLFNFFSDEPIVINLKPSLSPQDNAAQYYRKGKNQKKERAMLQSNADEKAELLLVLNDHLQSIAAINSVKELRKYANENGLQKFQQDKEEVLPYYTHQYEGFHIWIGKNARGNDELLKLYAKKNDLWFHAKGVAGSHVLLKDKPGKPFPKTVIEKAASLAAYYSKGKTDSLCPVMYTFKKYIRKPKGALPGQVKVDKETIIQVKPTK